MKAIQLLAISFLLMPLQLLASNTDSSAKQQFFIAKQRIENMLCGKESKSYEKAIYEIENAWWEGGIEYASFKASLDYQTEQIKTLVAIAQKSNNHKFISDYASTKAQKEFWYRNLVNNHAIYQYLTNASIWVNGEEMMLHQPFTYSHSDPMGTTDWTNTQVTHLINEKQGNCFALASLFKIFADRLHTDAQLCTAPSHIFITHADEKGVRYNIELASNAFPCSGTLATLTHTTNDALKNGIALRELDVKQSIALCLVELAKGYENKLGIKDDEFMMSCATTALQYDEHNLNAMLLKAAILENRLAQQNKKPELLKAQNDYTELEQSIANIIALGYREMPFEMKNLLVKGWTKDTVSSLAYTDNNPKRMKQTKLKDTRYASLSWGLFDEEITTKPIERIGNTMFDTKKGKIVAFVAADKPYNNYDFDPVVFAWNVDPLASKFPSQSPYSSFGNNPIYNIDVGGAFQYPAKDAASYTNDFPMLTLYLAKNVQHDIMKSPIVQEAVTKNTYGGYSKQDLIWKVAAWGDKRSPEINYVKGLAKSANAYGHTRDAQHIDIDADFAKTMDNLLKDSRVSEKTKQAAITSFFSTLLDETTHTGDLKDGVRNAPEVGHDATSEIFWNKDYSFSDGTKVSQNQPNEVDDPSDVTDLSGTKIMINRKVEEGKSEVLPTVPQQ